MDLALNKLQKLICNKNSNQPTNQPTLHEISSAGERSNNYE